MAERVGDTDGSFGTDVVTNRRRHWNKHTRQLEFQVRNFRLSQIQQGKQIYVFLL